MPIKAQDILLSRVCGAYAMALLYTALLVAPGIVLYQIFNGFNLLILISGILMLLIESVIVTVITCALGYVVAIISSKIKNKSLTTVAATLVFLAAYYLFVFKIEGIMDSLMVNLVETAANAARIYPLYMIGSGYTGNFLSVLVAGAVSAILLFITLRIMSLNFFKIASIKDIKSNKKFEMNQIKTAGITTTLIKKELGIILNTPIYMLNAGLGIVFMILGAGALIYKSADVASTLVTIKIFDYIIYNVIIGLLPAAIVLMIGMIVSMDAFSASSISLEGKSIWQIQCLPVSYKEVLNAKAYTCIMLNGVPAIILAIVAVIVLKADVIGAVLAICGTVFMVVFFGYFDLLANILSPNFKWTNPTTVVKQSTAVFVSLFGGWGIIVGLGFICYKCVVENSLISPLVFSALVDVFFLSLAIVLRFVCEKLGTKLLRDL